MQVKQEDIKRPSLIEMVLDKELFPDNSIATYIDCTTKRLNVVHKRSVTPDTYNIEKSLKTKNIEFDNGVQL